MAIGTDFEVQNDKDIRYIGAAHGASGAGYYTVLELHRWAQDLADDAAATGDDFMDMTRQTPSDKSFDTIINLINGFNIDAVASEHLYSGSIIQAGGAEIWDGVQVIAGSGAHVEIVQNGAVIANDFWNNIPFGTGIKGLNPDAANGIASRFLVLVRTVGADINGRILLTQTREWGKTFSEFKINGTSRGINVSALTYADDLNNTTASATVATYDDITNDRTDSTTTVSGVNGISSTTLNVVSGAAFAIGEFIAINDGAELGQYQITNIVTNALTITPGLDVATAGGETIWKIGYGFEAIDVDNNAVNENYYTKWDKASRTINQFYERMKYLTQRGTTNRLFGINAELFRGITHDITVDTPTGTFRGSEAVSWSGGAGRMLAINSPTAATKMYIQLLTGVAPTDNQSITGAVSTATCLVNVTVTERTLSAPFCGNSTGTSIIGSYGFGIEALDLSASDKLFDLTNTQRTPPNFVTFTVGGLVSTEDYVLVGPAGFSFEYDAEASGPFTVGSTLTFTSPAGTAVLAELIDRGTTGEMIIGPMLTGSTPADNSGITSGATTASVNGAVSNNVDVRQMTLNGALVGAAVTAVVVTGTIPTDTPSTGSIRILRANGIKTKHAYTAYATSTFTIASTDFSTNNAANGAAVFVSYIDKLSTATSEAFTSVFLATRALFIRVRDGGGTPIKTFETTGTLGSAGGSSTAIRTSDL